MASVMAAARPHEQARSLRTSSQKTLAELMPGFLVRGLNWKAVHSDDRYGRTMHLQAFL